MDATENNKGTYQFQNIRGLKASKQICIYCMDEVTIAFAYIKGRFLVLLGMIY